jgi:hypothetical protein
MAGRKEIAAGPSVEWCIKGIKVAPSESARIEQGYQLFRADAARFVLTLGEEQGPDVHAAKANFVSQNIRCVECPGVAHPLRRSVRSKGADGPSGAAQAPVVPHGSRAHVVLHALGVGSWMDAVDTPFMDSILANAR